MLGFQKVRNKIMAPSSSGAILMYHHIGHCLTDPWETTVSEAHFREHLHVLKQAYDVLPLGANIFSKPGPRKKICLTFDDGYRDNYDRAIPVLREFGFSATFFIPTQVLHGKPYFWWEAVDHLFWAQDKLPDELRLVAGKSSFIRTLSSPMSAHDLPAERSWSANQEPPPTARCQLYLELCDWIKQRSVGDQQAITQQLMDLCLGKDLDGYRKMEPEQIQQLAKEGFDIGAHTIHHPALGFQTDEIQQHEITASKKELEALLEKNVVTMAYPHGHLNAATVPLTQKAGYQWACTTERGVIHHRSNLLALPRIWIKDTDGASFKRDLEHIFTSSIPL